MRILITGSHGFVGTNLIEALSREHEIICWNVREDKELPEIEVVIHCAAKVHDVRKTRAADGGEFFETNTELTKRLYDRVLQSSAKKFIFFSSIKAQDFDTPYAKSKKLAEEYIESLKEQTKGKKYYILRPCMIHGKGNKGNLYILVKWVKKGIPWPLGAFENKRTFTSIDNLCYIIEGLLTKDVESGIYNINDDESISTNELIEIICEATGKKARIWKIPKILMNIVAKLGGALHLPLNPERLQKLTENYVSSNAKIKKALGVDELPVRAKDGLMKTIRSFENNKKD